jgi:uncharacterized protein YbjT (DUF2867 family)
MKVLVIGSTGGSGRAAVKQLLARGHEVTAFTRGPAESFAVEERLRVVRGDALSEHDVERAVEGQEAVVVTLGISENPLKVRLWGSQHTPLDVRSAGTRNVIAAMHKKGVRKLVVQSSYGVGATRDRLGFLDKLFFTLLIKPQIVDTERQEQEVARCGLDWVLLQPVHLYDGSDDAEPFLSAVGETGRNKVSRNSVGRSIASAVESSRFVQQSVAVSAPA